VTKVYGPSTHLRILFTNIVLNGRTGTETLTRDLVSEMRLRGHECQVYTHAMGPIAKWLVGDGVRVTDDIARIEGPIDVIHGHHTTVAGIAAVRFPRTPAIFVCHDVDTWYDAPPCLPNFFQYVSIGPTAANRLISRHDIPNERLTIIPNGVDQKRFRPGPPLPAKCGTALAFCKTPEMVAPIRDACQTAEIQVDFVGYGAQRPVEDPEKLMPQYDLIFCSGLTAREALSCRRAVVCCDNRGLGGMITLSRLKEWDNNLGLRVLDKPLSAGHFYAELQLYNSEDATLAAETFAAGCSIADAAQRYESVYQAAISEGRKAARRIRLGSIFGRDGQSRVDPKATAQFIETYARRT
jgi:glycosyltransferase involved in cell wall biosynthesis